MKFLLHSCVYFLIFSLGIYLYLALYIKKNAEKDNKKPADVILVLGAQIYRHHSYNPCLVARVKQGVDLYKAHYAPKLLFSGGLEKDNGSIEAQAMKNIALSYGIPAQDILLESNSTTTYENLLFSQKILKKNKLKSIILVTEPFHLPRAILVAKKLGLEVVGSPALNSYCWKRRTYLSHYFLREPFALIVYKLENKL